MKLLAYHGFMRIGFFGGSFDPPHNGHLAVAKAAFNALHLDRVLWAPVGLQPLKPDGSSASYDDRAAMVGLAIADDLAFELSRVEAPGAISQPNYTIDALESLRARFPPETNLYLLMGADAFRGLRNWRRAADIPLSADLVVAARPGEDLSDLSASLPLGFACEPGEQSDVLRTFTLRNTAGVESSLYLLPGVHAEVSATDLRQALRSAHAGSDLASLLPAAVAQYIREHGLYRQ
jgi:nicotinate-nucleotide adenylyltransferase